MDILVTTSGIAIVDHRAWQRLPRRVIRMVPEGYDTSRAFVGWTWDYPRFARLMFTWRWRGKWHRLYTAFGFWFRYCDFLLYETWPQLEEE